MFIILLENLIRPSRISPASDSFAAAISNRIRMRESAYSSIIIDIKYLYFNKLSNSNNKFFYLLLLQLQKREQEDNVKFLNVAIEQVEEFIMLS